jgi:D-alanyl-D-alanine carboxypeptidase
MPKKSKLTMRARRMVTLGTTLLLAGTTIAAFALPGEINLNPTSFDPPRLSLTESSSIWVVVNKQNPLLTQSYTPKRLSYPAFPNPDLQNPDGLQLRKNAAVALTRMAAAMEAEGAGSLILNSGFRGFSKQKALYEGIRKSKGYEVAEQLSARPGHSEHQTGLAADLAAVESGCVIMVCFGKTDSGIWLRKNAYRFGFILRYPAGMTPITGFQYEPWHFRFVGVELSTEMKTRGIKTLEEFWNLSPAPTYSIAPSPSPSG